MRFGRLRRPEVPADRRFVAVCAGVVVLALIAALVAGAVWLSGETTDEGERVAVEEATAAAVGELMTFAPGDEAAARDDVAARLSGSLAADYLTRGPDVVFPGATGSRVTMATTVLDVGVAELRARGARTLVFADQQISLPGESGEPERIAVTRWATLIKDGDRWLLTRLEPVGSR